MRLVMLITALGVGPLGCAAGTSGSSAGGGGGSGGSGGSGGLSTGGMPPGGNPATGGNRASGGASGQAGNSGSTGGAGLTGPTASGGSLASGGSRATGGAGSGGIPGSGGNGGGGPTPASGGAGVGGGDPCGPGNPAAVPLPVIGPGTFNVTTFGAVGDGRTNNTRALQAALDAAATAGGGTVVVPAGTFLSDAIVIGSSTRLEISAGAVLEMLPRGSYAATTAFITATPTNAHDIALTGAGTIEGQGQAWWDAFAADSTIFRPQEVSLSHVTRVQVSGLRFQNPPVEHIWVKQDTNVTVTGITISTLAVAGRNPPKNTDGVDISATGAFLCNNNIVCGDDNIALSGTNIYIAYSTFGLGHGCSIGSITQNGTSGLTVDHVTFNGTTSGIRMKSARDRGGLVQNLTYSNITMTNVPNPVFIASYYPDLPTDPTVDPAVAIAATTPIWRNVTIRNLTATGSTNAGIIWGLPEERVATVVFDNVRIQATTGMQIFHATGVSFINGSSVTPRSGTVFGTVSGAAATIFDATVSGITTTPF